MAIPRFLITSRLAPGELVPLPEAIDHHARRVLRLQAGAALILFDGNGCEFAATLEPPPANDNTSHFLARIHEGGPVDREARLPITLVQAMSTLEKIDWLIEKAVELGIGRLIVAPSQRSVVRLDGPRRERRAQRWRDIAAGACSQCGRNRIPEIRLALSLEEALQSARGPGANWILDPGAVTGLDGIKHAAATLVVGPEGGFTQEEMAMALALGYSAIRLGARILRTETAGLVAASALLALHGEFS